MNTTAFGLIAAIPLLLMHAMITSRASEIIDGMEMISVKTLNLIADFTKRQSELAAKNG
jgi:biopolymer transport protein ExbB